MPFWGGGVGVPGFDPRPDLNRVFKQKCNGCAENSLNKTSKSSLAKPGISHSVLYS